MSRFAYEGKTKLTFVTGEAGITDLTAPTEGELTGAGATDLTGFTTKDGLNTPQNQNNIDSATLADIFDAQIVGSWGGTIELTCFRDDTTDEAWELFTYGLNGFVVVRRGEFESVAYQDGDEVEVYPVQSHQPVHPPSAANELQRLTVALPVRAEPELKAVVGGGS